MFCGVDVTQHYNRFRKFVLQILCGGHYLFRTCVVQLLYNFEFFRHHQMEDIFGGSRNEFFIEQQPFHGLLSSYVLSIVFVLLSFQES